MRAESLKVDKELDFALRELLGGATTFFFPPSAPNPTGPAGNVEISRAFISRPVCILHGTVRSLYRETEPGEIPEG